MENLEEKKTKKSTGKTVVIILLIIMVLGLGGFIVYDKVLSKPVNDSNKNNEEVTTKDEVKEKVLDVNGRLVQELYNSVVDGGTSNISSSKYWIYNKEDFDSPTADELIKMQVVGINLDSNFKIYLSNDQCSKIPATAKVGYELRNICNPENGTNQTVQYYYSKTYVESLYKKLYGSDAKLDTSKYILTSVYGIDAWVYVPEFDGYFNYVGVGGGTSGSRIYSTLSKATLLDDTITIYETATERFLDDKETTTNYVYTFKLDSKDNLYNFISRKTVK